jgi:hypothetical protein
LLSGHKRLGQFSFLVALARSLTGLAILLKVSFKFQDDDVYQARGKWIGHLPFQEPIARNLSF